MCVVTWCACVFVRVCACACVCVWVCDKVSDDVMKEDERDEKERKREI